MSERIAVIGLGYVGLPLAMALAHNYREGTVIGYDIDAEKVDEINRRYDRTGEADPDELELTTLRATANLEHLKGCTFFIVAVPTPVHDDKSPDFSPLEGACEAVGMVLQEGGVVCFESTVFPGVTEDICAPIVADVSGLDRSQFKLGYSPERINPGDKAHNVYTITKVVAGEDAETLDRVAAVYGVVTELHRASSIKVAEAAKVIENVQRDVNIALMNELAQLFGSAGISTKDVLEAAGTKWNFAKYKPGLVGGHCVGVDPYYLMMLGDNVGVPLKLVSLARRVNEGMPRHIAIRVVEALKASSRGFYAGARVAVLGCTFKENVNDLRNSKVFDMVKSLRARGCEVDVDDRVASRYDMRTDEFEFRGVDERCVDLIGKARENKLYDAVILAVPHDPYMNHIKYYLKTLLAPGGVVVDVKGVLSESDLPAEATLVTI